MKTPCARGTVAALALLLIASPVLAEEQVKASEGEAAVTGNPPPEHAFAKIKPGMKFEEVAQILGKPNSERAFCTGKHYIPFYAGRDRAYTEHYFQGQGVVVFYTDVSTWGIGRYKHCTPKAPLELAEVHYNPKESGVAPKDTDEAKKEPAEAEK